MSMTAQFTLHCEGNWQGPCTATVTTVGTENDVRQLASSQGWHVRWPIQPIGYDACPLHIKPLDRVDWRSTA